VLPLGIVGALLSLQLSIPRYFITYFHGEAALGIFAALANLVAPGQMMCDAVGQAALPQLAKTYADGRRAEFCKLLGVLLACGAFIAVATLIVSLFAGSRLLEIVYTAAYSDYAGDLTWVVVAGGIGYLGAFLAYSFNATRGFVRLVIPYSIAILWSGAVSYCLIPSYGVAGAAWALGCINFFTGTTVAVLLLTSSRRRPVKAIFPKGSDQKP